MVRSCPCQFRGLRRIARPADNDGQAARGLQTFTEKRYRNRVLQTFANVNNSIAPTQRGTQGSFLMTALLCVGHSALDTIFSVPEIPATPIKVLATACVESGGGMAANASVAASRLGAQVSYCGRVGNDAAGTRILAQLAAERVDVTMVRRVDRCQSPIATILVDRHGERLICIYNDPALDPDPSWLPVESIRKFSAVLADVRWPEGAARMARRRARGQRSRGIRRRRRSRRRIARSVRPLRFRDFLHRGTGACEWGQRRRRRIAPRAGGGARRSRRNRRRRRFPVARGRSGAPRSSRRV